MDGDERTGTRSTNHTRSQRAPDERLGGDAACWAHRVCDRCGRLNAAEHPLICENCGAAFE